MKDETALIALSCTMATSHNGSPIFQTASVGLTGLDIDVAHCPSATGKAERQALGGMEMTDWSSKSKMPWSRDLEAGDTMTKHQAAFIDRTRLEDFGLTIDLSGQRAVVRRIKDAGKLS